MTRKRKQEPERSPAWQLLAHVWRHCPRPGESGFSWIRLNRSMREALCLAISSRCSFDIGDFAGFLDAFSLDRWSVDAEGLYGLAVIEGNRSAVESFEQWRGRGPFIADDVTSHGVYGSRTFLNRQRTRLVIGFSFPWQGEQITVTSFSDDGTYLTACSYKPRTKDDPYRNEVLHRYKITVADLQADRKERKRRDVLYAKADKLTAPQRRRLNKSLGVATWPEWDKLSPERIEAAIKEVTT